MSDFSYLGWLGPLAPPTRDLAEALAAAADPGMPGTPDRWIEVDPLAPRWIAETVDRYAGEENMPVVPAIRVGGQVIGRGGLVVCSSPDLAGRIVHRLPEAGSVCVQHWTSKHGACESVEVVATAERSAAAGPRHGHSASRGPNPGASSDGPGRRLAKRIRQVPRIRIRTAPHPAWCLVDLRRPVMPVLARMRAAGVEAGEALEAPGHGGVMAAVVSPNASDATLARFVEVMAGALASPQDALRILRLPEPE